MAHGTEKSNEHFRRILAWRNEQQKNAPTTELVTYPSNVFGQTVRWSMRRCFISNICQNIVLHGTELHAAHHAKEPQWYVRDRQSSANMTSTSCDACIFYTFRRIHLLWNSILESLCISNERVSWREWQELTYTCIWDLLAVRTSTSSLWMTCSTFDLNVHSMAVPLFIDINWERLKHRNAFPLS